ncbi:TRIC cation channel family protein [Trinickia violacea]
MSSGLDLPGVLVLSSIAELGGGIIRDLLIGALPPSVPRWHDLLADWRRSPVRGAICRFTMTSSKPHRMRKS